MSTTGLNFSFTTSGGYSENHYKNGTNCSFGFKITKGTGKNIIILFGLRNFDAGTGSYSYGYGSSSTINDNKVIVNGTSILLGDSHNGKYNYTGVGNSWKDCSGMTWTITLTSGGASGNTAIDIPYYMEMNNSCYPGGAEGYLQIPAGIIPSTEYYTSCGAPTSVSINTSIVKPGGSITVNWSGASNGTNNRIQGYGVYVYATSAGTNPSSSAYTYYHYKEVTLGTTSSSLAFDIGTNLTRGYTIVAGVISIGEAGSAYYSGMKCGGSCKINTLPGAPSLNKTYQYFPSGGGSVSVTVTAGATNDSGLSATLYYNTSNSHSGLSSMTSGSTLSPTLSADTTYYFWTWDGLEYSSASTFTGYKNSTIPNPGAPTIESVISGTSSLSGKSGTLYSRLGSIKYNSMTRSRYATNTGASCSLTVTIYYRNRGSSNNYGSKYLLSTTNIGTNTSYNVGVCNLVNLIGVDLEWYIQASLSDGYDLGNNRYPTSGVYYTPPRPTFNAFYNRQNSSDISLEFAGYFYKTGRVYLSKETMFTSITLNFSISTDPATTLTASGTVTQLTSEEYFNFSIGYNSTYAGKTLILTSITLSDGYNAVNINNPGVTRIIIYEPTLRANSLSGMVSTYKPYTNTSGTATITAGLTTGLTTSNYTSYGMTSTLSGIVLSMNYGNNSLTISSGSWSISNDTLSRTINLNGLYSPSSNPLQFPTIYGSYTYTLKITITNAFGYTSTVTKDYTINFAENPVIPSGDYILKETSENGVSITNLAIQKDMTIYYSFKILSYNLGTVSYVLSYSLNSTSGTKTTVKSGKVSFSENTGTGIMSSSALTGSFACPTFTTGGNIYFHLTVTNSTTNLSATRYISSVRNAINDANISISAALSDSNVAVTVSYTNNIGLDLRSPTGITYTRTYTTVVYADQNANPSTSVKTLSNQSSYPPAASSLTFTPPENMSVFNIKVITTLTITETYKENNTVVATYSTTLTLTSNVYSFYGEIPTISYRKNYIIINNAYGATPSDTLIVTATENRNRIRLVGVGNLNNGIINLGTATTLPSLVNFTIDCGSW